PPTPPPAEVTPVRKNPPMAPFQRSSTSTPVAAPPPAAPPPTPGVEATKQAYDAQDLAQVIQLARALGPDAPPAVAEWVALAWFYLPVEVKVLTGHTNAVMAVALSADGRQALSGSDDTTLRLWDVASGQCLRS